MRRRSRLRMDLPRWRARGLLPCRPALASARGVSHPTPSNSRNRSMRARLQRSSPPSRPRDPAAPGLVAARAPTGPRAVASEPTVPPRTTLRALLTLALGVWGLGSIYLGARLLHGSWRMRRLWRRVRPLDGGRWGAEL